MDERVKNRPFRFGMALCWEKLLGSGNPMGGPVVRKNNTVGPARSNTSDSLIKEIEGCQ